MVTIYTVPKCPKCALLKRKAAEHGIEFQETYDVSEAIAAGYRSAPVMKINNCFYAFKDALDFLQHMGA